MRKLALRADLSQEERALALEAAFLLGFQTESATFPIAGADGQVAVPRNAAELEALFTLPVTPDPSPTAPRDPASLFELDFREEKGLEELFSRGPLLPDTDCNFLPDQRNVKLVLPPNPDLSVMIAACNIAFRLGMETTAYQGSILAGEGYQGNAILLEDGAPAEMTLEKADGALRIHLRGRGKELEDFSSVLCEKFPGTGSGQHFRDLLMNLCDDAALRNADGQLAALKMLQSDPEKKTGMYEVFCSPELTDEQKSLFPGTAFTCFKDGKEAYQKSYSFPWEVDVWEQILEEQVYPLLRAGDTLQVKGALSEERKVRQEMERRIQAEGKKRGASQVEAQLLCAYKQGFSWLCEGVIPAVRQAQPDQLEIYFKPFLPAGETEWLDENGATPSRFHLQADDPDKWCDLPVRWLQELYPIEDILTRELGLDREKIRFLPYKGNLDLTYLCRAYRNGAPVYEGTYEAQYAERPYLDSYPEMGKVHPSTGYLRVWVNGKEVLFQKLPTDLERIWNTYQAEVLPDGLRYIEGKNGGTAAGRQQPLFQTLRLEVSVSEPDGRVGCREDLISSLDGLHEDLYFVGSDYFKKYGLRTTGTALDAPGLILPVIHKKEGAPSLCVTLLEKCQESPGIQRDSRWEVRQRERKGISFWIRGLRVKEEKFCLDIASQGVSAPFLRAYASLLEQGALHGSREWPQVKELCFLGEDGSHTTARIPEPVPLPGDQPIEAIDFHEGDVIGYEQYREIIEKLKAVPGIEVFRTARSYAGRELYAIWLKPDQAGYLSMTKRLTKYPSMLINARHHANEVSATNAAFLLLKKLLTEDSWQGLSQRMNLVLVPLENVDGAAIHYELQKEHPWWKLHVARFNAVGKEFFQDHFLPDTIHGEAMGLTRLYERYLPDIVIDNHGVPSHEWDQQFSGYTPPAFKGFWLPRSLLYGYFWYVTDEAYRENYAVNKKLEDRIADAISDDAEMTTWNLEWSAQFEKYAHKWMPRLFPAEYYKNMIHYWIPYSYSPSHAYPSLRFPWITAVSYTSEVADETAQGEYLKLCARTHVAHDEAAIRMLAEAQNRYECRFCCREGEVSARFQRIRPVCV